MRIPAKDSDFEALVDYAYNAAFDESLLPRFLDHFAEALGGQNTALLLHDTRSARHNAVACVRTDPEHLRRYNQHYCDVNPWIRKGAAKLSSGIVGVGEMHVSSQELVRTEFYNEWLQPQKLKHSIAALVSSSGGAVVVCSSLRTGAAGPFETGEIKLFEALAPHLRRAFRALKHAGNVFGARRHALELLNELPQACVLVDREARPVFVNRAAELLLSGNASLRLGAGGLIATRHEDSAALRLLISRAGNSPQLGGEMAVRRERGQPILILVSPIRSHYELPAPTQAVAAVWISDPDAQLLSRSKRIRTLFGLTSTEACIMAEVARGMTVAEIADVRKLSRHTVRNHLKSIFAKTGARSQADLVRAVLSCPDLVDTESHPD